MPRPRRYKSYNRTFEEAEDENTEIPESTLRSRKKRKRHSSSSSVDSDDSHQNVLHRPSFINPQSTEEDDLICETDDSNNCSASNENLGSDTSVHQEASGSGSFNDEDEGRLNESNNRSSLKDDSSHASTPDSSEDLGSDWSDSSVQEETSGSGSFNNEDYEGRLNQSNNQSSSKADSSQANSFGYEQCDESFQQKEYSEEDSAEESTGSNTVQSSESDYEFDELTGRETETSDFQSRQKESRLGQTSDAEPFSDARNLSPPRNGDVINQQEGGFEDTNSSLEERGASEDNFSYMSDGENSEANELRNEQGENADNTGDDLGDNVDAPNDPYQKLKLKLQNSFNRPLNFTVTSSIGEILTNALTLVKKHNWNHSEKEDLMKFTNALLNSDATVPSSRFLLDKYFYSKEGMTYHFFCSKCSHYLFEVSAAKHSETQFSCPNEKCKMINCISDLSKATYFVTFDLPSQLQILLNDPKIRSKLLNPLDFTEEPEDSVMHDLHHGSSYRAYANYVKGLPNDKNTKYVSFSLSVDSASLCSSFSGQSICPCFIMLNELPPVLRMGNLLVAGLWFGLNKEKMDLLLPPIVKHIVKLSSDGFLLHFKEESWHMTAHLIDCVADSVARCDVQGIHGHRGDFPCSWCLIEGEEYAKCRVFPFERILPPPRTIKELFDDSKKAANEKRFVRGVKYFCLLAGAPLFHPVKGFIVDQMHAKDEGTTKAFLNSWLGEDGKTSYYLKPPVVREVNALLKKVRLPRECRKKVRSLDALAYWTGRELENWMFFLSLPVLDGKLPNLYLKHWALYVQGTYLLLNTELHLDVVDLAEKLLEEFCSKTEALYGRHMMRFNLHILRHFAQNCRRWGPMFALSAYAFEAGNQHIKKLVHDCNGIPNQICRGLSEDNALLILRDYCESTRTKTFAKNIEPKSHATRAKPIGKIELMGISKSFKASEEERWLFNQMGVNVVNCAEYKLLKKDGCYFGSDSENASKTDNSFARLNTWDVVRISKVIHDEQTNNIWVIGNRVRYQPSRYCPMEVIRYDTTLSCLFDVTSIDEDISIYEASALSTVCVSLPFSHGHFIIPMPNIFNMF